MRVEGCKIGRNLTVRTTLEKFGLHATSLTSETLRGRPTLPSRRVRFLNRNASRTRQKSERREGETVSLPQIVNPTHSPCFVVPNCDACSLGPSADTKSRIDAEVILSSPSRKCGCAATRSSRLTTSGRGRLAHPLAPDARRASEHAS